MTKNPYYIGYEMKERTYDLDYKKLEFEERRMDCITFWGIEIKKNTKMFTYDSRSHLKKEK